MTEAGPAEGRVHAAGERAFVLALPLPTSLPIPLGVTAPAGVALATWAFAGLATTSTRVLLLLAARDAAAAAFLREGQGALTLATHYRDVTVSLSACAPFDALPGDERRLLARAVLADAQAVLALLDALPDFDPATERQPPAADAPTIAFPRAGAAVLSGSAVPDRLLLRAGTARWLARVAAARLHFAPEPGVALTLDEPGRPTGASPETALALSGEGAVALRVGTA